jgi:non-specific serine/threonine protein kinase
MATSREVLRADGEVVWRVPSLSLPSREAATPLEQLTQYEAVRLFIDRAMAAGPQFRVTNDNAPAVAEICWRLDGIPLAIELAAARVNVLAPEQIRERLDDRFRLLTNGRRTALPRQQTLRAAVEWSYALLPGREQRLFDRLSVLAGSFSLDAAETVCVGDGIDSEDVLDLLGDLVSRSLVVGEGGAEEPRYRVLETLRAYGSEQIDRADAGDALRRRHATFYFGLAKQAHAELRGPAEDVWLRRLEAEYDNLRAVLGWAETHEPEGGGRLVSSLGRFWNLRGQWAEARTWCDRYLAVRHHMAPRTAADIVFWAADLAGLRSDLPLARELWEECLALGRAQGDQRRVADALRNLGNICLWSGDYRGASRSFEESLPFYEQSGDKLGASGSLAGIATAAQEQGDYESAVRWYNQALATTRRVGSAADVAVVLSNLGNIALVQGEPSRARALHEEALGLRRGAGHRVGVAQSEICLGVVAEAEGDYAAALAHFQAALAVASELGDQRTIALAHRNLAGIHHIEGRWAEAGQECRRALSVAQGARDRRAVAACLEGLAAVAAATGDSSRGVRLFGAAESLRQTMGIPPVSFATDEYDRHTAAARDPLGDEAFQAAWAEGQGMSLDDAVAYALGAQDGE